MLGVGCWLFALVFWRFNWWFSIPNWWFVAARGLGCACLISAAAFAIREWAKSPLTADTTLRRTFFVLGIALLFPAFLLAISLYDWSPKPRHVSYKPEYFTFGSDRKQLYQNSTPIPLSEHTVLWITDEDIDHMFPMQLYFYFKTLEKPTFSHNFQENYGAVKDTHLIGVIVDIILFFLSIASLVVSFFMPKQTVVVTGWSGSEWQ